MARPFTKDDFLMVLTAATKPIKDKPMHHCTHHWVIDANNAGICKYCGEKRIWFPEEKRVIRIPPKNEEECSKLQALCDEAYSQFVSKIQQGQETEEAAALEDIYGELHVEFYFDVLPQLLRDWKQIISDENIVFALTAISNLLDALENYRLKLGIDTW